MVLVAVRFCEPSSELHIAEDWYRRTALCDLLQLGDEEVNQQGSAVSRPRSPACASALEAHLSQRCGELFATQNEVLLYDVMSRYFGGEAEANPQARRGYSRDHRPDCKQMCIALVVTLDGFPLGLRGVRRQDDRGHLGTICWGAWLRDTAGATSSAHRSGCCRPARLPAADGHPYRWGPRF